jgi:hypothetical protein
MIKGDVTISDFDIINGENFGNIGEEGDKIGNNYDPDIINIHQAELEEQKTIDNGGSSLEDSLNGFNPNMNLTGNYVGDSVEGNLSGNDSTIILPSNGQFTLEGNVTNLQSQYINNPGAENDEEFYSEDAIVPGLEVERLYYSGSRNGDYVWKFYSYNSESIRYALYQKDINLYDVDTKISYSYLLTSNSSLQNVINSSLIFDFVFDTCRIMVIHWHLTDVEPPSIGENTTSPFIVYRLLQNSSWNDQWNDYTLHMSDLFSLTDPLIPTILKSFGIYVISPEVSDCTVLFDDFELESGLTPDDINLKMNDIQVSSTGIGEGTFDEDILFEEGIPYEYDIYWFYNSNYEIEGNFTLKSSGTVLVPYTKQLSFENETSILLSIEISNLSLLVDPVNFSYPDTWIISGIPQGADVVSDIAIEEGYRNLSLARKAGVYDIRFQFSLPNQILTLDIENSVTFETLNATFSFLETPQNNQIQVFWFGGENGSDTGELASNNLEFTFPSEVASGSYEITFLLTEGNLIGYENTSVTLTREASELIVEQEVFIPKYAMEELYVSYLSLNHLLDIQNADVSGILDGEILPSVSIGDQYLFRISSFYLTENNYTLDILAQSSSHASVWKTVNITIYDSEIDIEFNYESIEYSSDFLLHFNVTSDASPVGLVPITIEINEYDAHSGITDEQGLYTHLVALPQDLLIVDINCSIFKAFTPIATKSFQITLENLLATLERSNEDAIISENITLTYDIHYPSSHDRWKYYIDDDMLPLLDVYIETSSLQVPVYVDSEALYWHIQANASVDDHKLKIVTVGPNLLATVEFNDTQISIHFVINSDVRSYSNVSILYYLNESYSTSKYDWKLLSYNADDVTNLYKLQVNDLYVYATNLDIAKGSVMILDLVGIRTSNSKSIANIVIPLVSSSGVLLGAVTAIIKVYNKKKGMILEI